MCIGAEGLVGYLKVGVLLAFMGLLYGFIAGL